MFKKAKQQASEVVDQTTEAMLQSGQQSGGRMAALASAFAILFSAVSLYQTVLKQSKLDIYIPETLSYTRDPYGAFEVFIVPVSIVNSGAQDGIVTALTLEVINKQTGVKRQFYSTYTADRFYFSTKADYGKKIKKPKKLFAPIAVMGQGNSTDTLLFYPKVFSKQRVLADKGDYSMTLRLKTIPRKDLGWLEKVLQPRLTPLEFDVHLPSISRYFEGQMLTGGTVRLFRVKETESNVKKEGFFK